MGDLQLPGYRRIETGGRGLGSFLSFPLVRLFRWYCCFFLHFLHKYVHGF